MKLNRIIETEYEDGKMILVFDLNSKYLLIKPQIMKDLIAVPSNYWLILIYFN